MSATTSNTKKITLLGMLAAIAYAVIFVCHFLIPPVAGFLTLDVKDTIIAIAGFIFGPCPPLWWALWSPRWRWSPSAPPAPSVWS